MFYICAINSNDMKTRFLFPRQLKTVGWIILIPSAILGIAVIFTDFSFGWLNVKVFSVFGDMQNNNSHWIEDNLTNELVAILFIIGALFAGFSRHKNEDEYIAQIRLDSLMWATYANYGLLILFFIFFYGLNFLNIMAINLFDTLILFLLRYNYMLMKNKIQLQ